MKKALILTTIFAFGLSCPAFSQSFLERALKKVDKTLNTADELINGKPSTKQDGQSAEQSTAKSATTSAAGQNTPFWFKTDLKKHNLNGSVKAITEIKLWDGVESISTYTYNGDGLVEEYKSEDGTVSCSYTKIDGTMSPTHISVRLAAREYAMIEWEGRQYTSSDVRTLYNDEAGHSHDNGVEDKIKYTYLDGMKVIRADFERVDRQMVPSFFVYDESGNLMFEYMESMDSQPIREIRYDTNGRKIYEKDPSGAVYEYRYNDHGDIVYRKTSNTFGEDEDSESTFEYSYDDRGNWIGKIWRSGGETVATYKRTIEYYQ